MNFKPGLSLENYVHSDLGNTTLRVLKGQVMIEIAETNTSLKPSEKVKVDEKIVEPISLFIN